MAGILESFLAGKEARRVADAAEQVNAMNAFLGQNGQAIFAGDQNALGQLAGMGPQGLQMALGMKGDLAAQERQAALDAQAAEDRTYNRGRDKITDQRADQKWEMELAEYKKGLSAEQAAAEAAKLENAAKMALTATSPEQWDQLAQENGAPDLVGQFDNREAVAARFMSMAEVLKANAPPDEMDALKLERERLEIDKLKNPEVKPLTEAAQLKADLDAGRIDQATYETEMQRRAPKGSKISFDPTTGAMTIEEGVGVGGSGDPTVGQVYNPNEVANVVTMIDEIMADPNLPDVVGNTALVLGGGNQVSEMNLAQRLGYGTGGMATIERIGQLQSNAWLSARAMLKGGGAITDYESKKAEAAVARLERPKDAKDFKQALKDLRDAITEGEAKLKGKGAAPAASPAPTDAAPSGEPTRLKYNPETGELE